MARAAPPDRPPRRRVLRTGLGRSRTHGAQSEGRDRGIHAFDPRPADRRGARHAGLEVDAPARGHAAGRGMAPPLARRPADRSQAADLPDAGDRVRSVQPPPRRFPPRGHGRGDRVRDLRARGTAACRVPQSDRHTWCCAHRVAGCGGRGARSDAEHGVGALTGVGHEAVSSSATPRSRLGRTPHAFCTFRLAQSTRGQRWQRRTDPGAS